MGGQNKELKGGLLEFQNTILEETHDPTSSELVVISRGLGLRTLVCRLLQLYESPNCLVLLVNARQEEELGIGEQLGLLGCRDPGLRIVGYEMPKKERQVDSGTMYHGFAV
jgi:DNA excision repair protein ERCC-4